MNTTQIIARWHEISAYTNPGETMADEVRRGLDADHRDTGDDIVAEVVTEWTARINAVLPDGVDFDGDAFTAPDATARMNLPTLVSAVAFTDVIDDVCAAHMNAWELVNDSGYGWWESPVVRSGAITADTPAATAMTLDHFGITPAAGSKYTLVFIDCDGAAVFTRDIHTATR